MSPYEVIRQFCNNNDYFIDQVYEHMKILWKNDSDLLKLIFGTIYCDEQTMNECKKGYEL